MKPIKKFLSSVLAVAMLSLSATPVFAKLYLSNTTQINNANGSTRYAQATNAEYHTLEDYGMHFYSDGSLWIETNLKATESVPAGQYTVTWEAKGIADGDVLYFYFQDWATYTHSGVAEKEDLGDGWTKYTATVNNADAGDTFFFFHNENKTKDCYIDNVRVVDANGKNYVLDSEFEDLTYTNGEASFKTSNVWTNQSNALNYVEPYLKSEDAGEGYSLHFYAEGDGVGLEFFQSYTETLPAGQYTLTWYAKGTGTMFFYSGWGEFAAGEVNSSEWTKITKTLNINGDGDTYFLFTHDANTAIDCYFDHISLVDGYGVDYIKDGGFDEVSAEGTLVEEIKIKYTISEPTFEGLTADGKLQQGTVIVNTEIVNLSMGDEFCPVIIVALYDGMELKTMTYAQMRVVESIYNFGNEFSISVDIPEVTNLTDYKLKIMYWDGFDTLAPLGGTDLIGQ